MKRLFPFLFIGILYIIHPTSIYSQFQQNDIFINEFYVNPSINEGKEYVELVVAKDSADLRGIRLSDVGSKNGSGKVDEGHLTFPNMPFLSRVPKWTIILCMLQTPIANTPLFAQDSDYTDGHITLWSKGIFGGWLDTIGRMDLGRSENIEVLTNGTLTAKTIDFVGTGSDTSHSHFTDTFWPMNLDTSFSRYVTYFTNAPDSNGYNNDNAILGWVVNKDSTFKTPGTKNRGQKLPSVNFPPSVFDVSRSPWVPSTNVNDTVFCHATDNAGIARAVIIYELNDDIIDSSSMTLISGTALDGIYRGVIPGNVNNDMVKVDYYVRVADNGTNSLSVQSSTNGYFAGVSKMNSDGIKLLDANGAPVYSGYGVRVKGTATVSSGVFSTTDLDIYLQDEYGGGNVFLSDNTTNVQEGAAYVASGTIGNKNGRWQISSPQFSIIQTAPAISAYPQIISISAYLANPEVYEGSLVLIPHCSKQSGTWPTAGIDAQIPITDGNGSITLYIDGNSDVGNYPEPPYPANFVGVAYQNDNTSPYTSNRGIILRGVSDISVGPVNQAPVIENLTRTTFIPFPNESDTVYVTVSDDGDLDVVRLIYSNDNGQTDSVVMSEVSKRTIGKKHSLTFKGILPSSINQNGKKVKYYVHAIDAGDPPLGTNSEQQKYFAGITQLAPSNAKKVDDNGELLNDGYAIRIRGIITVGDSTFSLINRTWQYSFKR